MNPNTRRKALLAGACIAFLLGSAPSAFAFNPEARISSAQAEQGRKIVGTVVDNDGEPIIGANIVVKGTGNGTITDLSGNFTIMTNVGATLEISFVGYETQVVKATASKMRIVLKDDSKAIDEVVVVGYGTMKKSDLSGASVSMSEDKIKGSIITSLDQSLQGRAAGVTSVATSGAPGTSSSIRVRGTATINAGAEPLYVIDGVIVQTGGTSGASYGLGDALGNGSTSTISPLSTIDPADIVSMEILKDASATAIYGAQGANGVILITTKHGKTGEAKFSYNGMVAAARQTKRLDMMNLREFAEFYKSFIDVGEAVNTPNYIDTSLLGKGTNWQDAIFQTALQHSHQISAQGGSEKVKYYVSGSYMNQEGTIIGSNFERLSFRTNLDADLKKWLKLGLSITYSNTKDDLKLADSDEGLINYSLTSSPAIPIYNVDGTYSSVSEEGYTNPNPIALAMMDEITLKRQKLSGNVFLEIKPFKDLTWHAEIGYDIGYSKGETYEPMVALGNWKRTVNTSQIQKNNNTYWQLKNYITYAHKFDQHDVTAMLGQECWESSYDYEQIGNTGLPSDEVKNPSLGSGTPSINYGFGSSAMSSFFTRLTYSFDSRYNLTYTFRRDGSSNFGPNRRWANFHSMAGSWRFSNEKFMESLNDIINNGKIRIGWGQTGNSSIGGYKWGSPLSKMESFFGMSYRPAQIANPIIQWETQEQINVGLDLGFFHDMFTITADWYRKESKDMLMPLQLPSYMGTSGNGSSCLASPWGNFGSIRNTGLEVTVAAHPLKGAFRWDSEFQISINRNKLIDLSDGSGSGSLKGYGQWSDVVALSMVGKSLFSFYGYVTDGIYTSLEDIEKSPKPIKYPASGVFDKNSTVWVGDIKYKDLNGDGVIDENDQTDIGSPMPKFTFGFTNTFYYKNFDLTIFINGSYGNKVANYMSRRLTHMQYLWDNQLTSVKDHAILVPIDANKDYSADIDRGDGVMIRNWYDDITNVTVANPSTKTPRVSIGDPNDNDRFSDRYIEDGSYIRLKNVSLGYTFPKKLVTKWGLETLRLYTNIQNLLTITNYTGYDPEVGASTASNYVMGLDNGRYPSPTTYSFGLNITF